MARPRVPTSILELRGTYRKHPERRRHGEPVVKDPFPSSAPAHLPPEVKTAWQAITDAASPGVLKPSDIFIVELAACLVAEHRLAPFDMPSSRRSQLLIILGSLGMTPRDRGKLHV